MIFLFLRRSTASLPFMYCTPLNVLNISRETISRTLKRDDSLSFHIYQVRKLLPGFISMFRFELFKIDLYSYFSLKSFGRFHG